MKELKETFYLFLQSLIIVGVILASTSTLRAEKHQEISDLSPHSKENTLDLHNQKLRLCHF